jgi:Vps51/Vps67
MTNLIASAEELLKTRTIPELRDLVYSLENDGNSKITELQVMVGSKYHDFIQSADAIAAMQQKSEFLESNLCRFLQLSEEIVLKTKDLLSRTVNSQSSDSHSVAPLKIYKGFIIEISEKHLPIRLIKLSTDCFLTKLIRLVIYGL